MIREDTVRLNLRLLAVYSLLFCFVGCSLMWIIVFTTGDSGSAIVLQWISALSQWWQLRAFLISSLFASALSAIYWFLARAWLYGGAPLWPVHATYWLAVAPLTFLWFSVLAGPIRDVLAP
ncbi:MAG: hypothetical protein AAGC96_17785 [Pseudomonadota bacterium]